ncbi:hypothetical protein E2C01_085794 [Portunus trituberculatus]|uniref:Uncharacterized protein n=1 Tax=Portunus trituberculatus TaxID=210409 RepID=A0A5B7J8I7_PORTR|nr:hypothetical protein [Portunus trituberculatus]
MQGEGERRRERWLKRGGEMRRCGRDGLQQEEEKEEEEEEEGKKEKGGTDRNSEEGKVKRKIPDMN